MGASSRTSRAVILCVAAAGVWRPAAAAERTTKTAQECSEELRRNEAALEAAGESASAFFHRCWWHSQKGLPTPIEEAKTQTTPAPVADNATSDARGAEAARKPRRVTVARRRSPDHWIARRRDREDDRSETVDAEGPTGVAAPPLAPPLPNQVNVTVPAVGSIAIPILPLPGLAATVREVVDHPVVPGIVSATP